MNEKEKMMTTKCEHKTSDTLASWARPKLSIDACTWGCGAILVSVTDDNGTNHEFTDDELLTLRERVAALDNQLLDTRCENHKDSDYPFYCTICGKPLPHLASESAPTYAALRERVAALEEYATASFEMQDLLGDDNSGIRINGATSSEASMRKAISISQRMWTARKKLEATAESNDFTEAANKLLETKADLRQKMADEGGE